MLGLTAVLEATFATPSALITVAGAVNWTAGFLTTVAIFAIVALALNIQWGYTGVFNFGVVAFFMVGAYTSALLTLPPATGLQHYVLGLQLPVVVGWLGGALAAGLLALLIGLPTLRLRGDFLAIATIGIAAVLRAIAQSAEGLVNRNQGLLGLPRFLGGLVSGADYRWVLLAAAVTLMLLAYWAVRAATESPWGRVLRAIRDNETTAQASGKATVSFRMQSFVVGSAIMGLAGAVYAHRVGSITPQAFDDLFGTFLVWTMLIVGGSGNNRGALLGALVVGFFWFGVPLIQESLPRALGNNVFALRQFAIGFLIVVFLLLVPQGLIAETPRVSRFVAGRTEAPSPWMRLRRRIRRHAADTAA